MNFWQWLGLILIIGAVAWLLYGKIRGEDPAPGPAPASPTTAPVTAPR